MTGRVQRANGSESLAPAQSVEWACEKQSDPF